MVGADLHLQHLDAVLLGVVDQLAQHLGADAPLPELLLDGQGQGCAVAEAGFGRNLHGRQRGDFVAHGAKEHHALLADAGDVVPLAFHSHVVEGIRAKGQVVTFAADLVQVGQQSLRVIGNHMAHLQLLGAAHGVAGADQLALDLAGDGLGQFLHKFHDAGVLVGRGDLLDVLLQLLLELLAGQVALGEHDGGLDHLTALGMRYGGDGAFQYSRVGQQGAFHLERPDAVAGGLDHIVAATDKVEVAVHIAPSHIAGVVEAVVEHRIGLLLIAVIAKEQACWMTLVQPDNNLAFHTVFHIVAFRVHQRDIIRRRGTARGAGLRLHPLAGHEQRRGFALAEAFVNLDAGGFQEAVVNFRVQGLASAVGPAQAAQIVGSQVFLDHETVHGGRRTEGRHLVLFQHGEHIRCDKAVKVVHKQGGAADPLTVQLAPARLGPAGICHGDVDIPVADIVPVESGDSLGDGIGPAVGCHLGHAGGAAGEVHQHDVIILGQLGRLLPNGGGSFHLRVKVDEALAIAKGEEAGQRVAILGRGQHMAADFILLHADDGLGAGGLYTVDDILFLQLGSGGNQHTAYLEQSHSGNPVLPAALEHQDDRVALFQAMGGEYIGSLVAQAGDLAKVEAALVALQVRPDQRGLFRGDTGIFIHNVVGKMKLLRHIEGKILLKILLGTQIRPDITICKHQLPNSFCAAIIGPYGITIARKCTGSSPTACMAWG